MVTVVSEAKRQAVLQGYVNEKLKISSLKCTKSQQVFYPFKKIEKYICVFVQSIFSIEQSTYLENIW